MKKKAMRSGIGAEDADVILANKASAKIKIIQYTNLRRATAKGASFDCPMCTNRIVSFCFFIIKQVYIRVHQLFLILP